METLRLADIFESLSFFDKILILVGDKRLSPACLGFYMSAWSIFIEEAPIAKARARTTKFGTYTPKRTRDAERRLKTIFTLSSPPHFEGPLSMCLTFYFKRPKSVKVSKRPHHIIKPDLTNLAKLVEDAGNKILYDDDSQIIDMVLSKRYCVGDQKEGIYLTLRKLSMSTTMEAQA